MRRARLIRINPTARAVIVAVISRRLAAHRTIRICHGNTATSVTRKRAIPQNTDIQEAPRDPRRIAAKIASPGAIYIANSFGVGPVL